VHVHRSSSSLITWKTIRLRKYVLSVSVSLQLLLETFFAHIDILRAETLIGVHVKCPLFLSDFKPNLNVSINVSKSLNIKFRENPLSSVQCFMNAEGQTAVGWRDFNRCSAGFGTRLKREYAVVIAV
jgi:hypothetical protein